MTLVPPRYGTIAAEQRAAAPPKPTANPDVPFRFSEAWGCPRAIAYRVLGVEPSDPATPADHHVMALGDEMHTDLQDAVTERYGSLVVAEDGWPPVSEWSTGATHEVKATVGDWSGHVDTIHDREDGGRTVVEWKSKGKFQFEKASGLKVDFNYGWKLKQSEPQAPDDAIAQLAMEVQSVDADEGRVVVLAREPISKNAAAALNLDDWQRYCVEFSFTRDELDKVAHAVRIKGEMIKQHLADGELPAGYDHESGKEIHPSRNPNWLCKSYCDYRSRCRDDGPGVIPVQIGDKK